MQCASRGCALNCFARQNVYMKSLLFIFLNAKIAFSYQSVFTCDFSVDIRMAYLCKNSVAFNIYFKKQVQFFAD